MIYRWLGRDNLAPTVVTRRSRNLDWDALEADVNAHSNDRLVDLAQRFGVRISMIVYALSQLKIMRKKSIAVLRMVCTRADWLFKNYVNARQVAGRSWSRLY